MTGYSQEITLIETVRWAWSFLAELFLPSHRGLRGGLVAGLGGALGGALLVGLDELFGGFSMPTSTPDIRLFVQLGALVGDLVVWLIVVGLGVGLVIAFGIILVSGLGVGLGEGLFAWLVYLNTGLDRETANVLGSVWAWGWFIN